MVLIGVVIIIIGFALKLDALAVVIFAGVTTGLVAGLGLQEVLEILGGTFVTSRYVSLFILTLPIVALSERYGLRERATILIKKIKNLSTGRLLSFYFLMRQLSVAASLSIGGHPQFVRPLIAPMAESALLAKRSKSSTTTDLIDDDTNLINEKELDLVKGASASSDNFGNFFGQNLFMGSSGVLLIASTLTGAGYLVENTAILSVYNIPIAITTFFVVVIKNYLLDRRLDGSRLSAIDLESSANYDEKLEINEVRDELSGGRN